MKTYTTLLAFLVFALTSTAQQLNTAMDSTVTTYREITIKGKPVKYKAIAGKQPVWDEKGKIIAGLYFTYYERTDIKDKSKRPLFISFNGGPGAASVWMHLGYTGPYRVIVDDEGYPVQPYGVEENPHSILDVADIVYVEPVNTGFSRPISTMEDSEVAKRFFGVNQDIEYLAAWINNFVTRQNRWASPKYLIGESYGTPRVSGLSLELQNSHWMYLNGVILVSPTGLGIERGTVIEAANQLPYYTAAAWFHKKLPSDLQSKDLDDVLPEVEEYTVSQLIPIMAKGGSISDAERKEAAKKIARYSGLSEKVVLEHNLRIPEQFFWKELLRDEGFTIGRLDSRYLGIDKNDSGERPDYAAEIRSWQHSFTPAINYYFKNFLNYNTDLDYYIGGHTRPWDRSNNTTGEDLRQAMSQNPYLHVMVQSGYYDGATDYFNSKYNLWQMDLSGKLKDRMSWKGYRSGHMMYLRTEDLESANEHIREFIKLSTPKDGQPAQYLRKTK
ncbi:Carboxypeptidase C (cathepsin A) [Flagellimonas taeanensis]|uniref:Carboxypeptidase C (Cathepsin A) n=1 Tax=Flagellimonas taeanensis TaxID=1005926 RepID=A0A1M6RMJ6_9FLAO|nr:carboxypeptidase [Allomuricauda taeanensis]SFB76046.1 Carboxypeptidase C (cathepsin A) [Allomuricauda taeanensis]SHK33659.1 Carboxypeptidase C (cathepsin A) [Allomuricauda taeanensis]